MTEYTYKDIGVKEALELKLKDKDVYFFDSSINKWTLSPYDFISLSTRYAERIEKYKPKLEDYVLFESGGVKNQEGYFICMDDPLYIVRDHSGEYHGALTIEFRAEEEPEIVEGWVDKDDIHQIKVQNGVYVQQIKGF